MRREGLIGPDRIALASGCTVEQPLARLLAFCQAEYAYYDAIPSAEPNRIEPLDVLVTVAMNSFVNNATKVRLVHQGLTGACDPLLPGIPEDANLINLDRWAEPLRQLLHAAVQAPWVLIPVATKVLHRKRRWLIPMLDSVVLRHYLNTPEYKAILPGSESKAKASSVAMHTLQLFHGDLRQAREEIEGLRTELVPQGFPLSPVRILELLIWTETEPAGYYRAAP